MEKPDWHCVHIQNNGVKSRINAFLPFERSKDNLLKIIY